MSILVIGNITVDHSYKVPRFPVPGETILAHDRLTSPGGKGLNQAVIAARSGAKVIFYSAIGEKTDNERIISFMNQEENLQTKLVRSEGFTDESIIYLSDENARNSIVSTDFMAKSITPEDVAPVIKGLEAEDIILLQGNLSEETTLYIIEIAERHEFRVIINLAPITYTCKSSWGKINYLVVNKLESEFLSGIDDPKRSAKYLKNHGIENVIITLGAEGALILDQNNKIIKIASFDVPAVDTTGAGDVFTGVFSVGISESLSLKQACLWASRSASICVSRRGVLDSFPTSSEIEKARDYFNFT